MNAWDWLGRLAYAAPVFGALLIVSGIQFSGRRTAGWSAFAASTIAFLIDVAALYQGVDAPGAIALGGIAGLSTFMLALYSRASVS